MSLPITWQQFCDKFHHLCPFYIDSNPFKLHETLVHLKCKCGEEFTSRADLVWVGKKTSCGCARKGRISRITIGHAKVKCLEYGIQLLTDLSDNCILQNTKVKNTYKFLCRCGKEFGERTTIKAVLAGNTRSCGCILKEATTINGIKRRGKTLSKAQVEASNDRMSIARSILLLKLEELDLKIDTLLPEIMSTRHQIKCMCTCGKYFTSRASDFIRGMVSSCGCIKSAPEIELFDFIKQLAPDAIHNDRKVIKPFEIDILVPGKLGIEFNGLYWHGEKRLGKKAKIDCLNKIELMKQANLRPLIFFEDEYKEHKTAVKGYIRSCLGLKSKVYARQCNVGKDGKDFIEQNHIQGTAGDIAYRLIHKDKTVAAITISKCHGSKALKDGLTYEIVRYCVGDVSVVGGLSKLISYVWKQYPDIVHLITYSDNRLSQGDIYRACGFKEVGKVGPRYWYFDSKSKHRHHRFGFRKDVLAKLGWLKEGETEWECMLRNNWDRVWDGGKIKWVLTRGLK